MKLTESEKEVFELLKRGLTHKQAGDILHIAKKSVDTRVYMAYKRNGVHSLAELLFKLRENNDVANDN